MTLHQWLTFTAIPGTMPPITWSADYRKIPGKEHQ